MLSTMLRAGKKKLTSLTQFILNKEITRVNIQEMNEA